MINLKNLRFSYNKKKDLFNGLNLHLEQGKIYGLLGKNGAGKSTTLRSFMNMIKPTSGSIKIFGMDII